MLTKNALNVKKYIKSVPIQRDCGIMSASEKINDKRETVL